jgi:GT2 family glycosyltransferase
MDTVTIACPTNRGIQPKTFQCLMELVAHGGYNFHIVVASEGYTIAENRNYIAVQALNNKSDYLLMIDDDMVFPPDTLDKLISNKKDICGVAYHSRGSSYKIKIVPGEIMAIAEPVKGKYINLETETDPKYKDVFECYATGTGIILIKCDVFYKIKRPWFEFSFHETGQCKEGEDWNFCFKAKDKGFKIYTDPTIKVGHIGEIIYV